jgi:hypothetical protein
MPANWIGKAIVDPDGAPVGQVSSAQGGYVKVDAPLTQDYWLREEHMDLVHGVLRLHWRRSDIPRYRVDAPPAEVAAAAEAHGHENPLGR